MGMVVLVQDESAQLRAEVHTPDLGRQLPDQAHSLGGDPALQPIPGIVHADPDVLHHEILVALEATVLRNIFCRLPLDRLVDLKLCCLVALAAGLRPAPFLLSRSLAFQRRGLDHRFRLLTLQLRKLIAQRLNLFLLPMTEFQQEHDRRRHFVGGDIRDTRKFPMGLRAHGRRLNHALRAVSSTICKQEFQIQRTVMPGVFEELLQEIL
jgi:hypothetical protein